jgi:hypothetical protein
MKILLRHGKSEEWNMVESAKYQDENELQKLLADSPSIISIGDVRPGAGALVTAVREFPLDIGYVDLVTFSAQGDMVIIECKLADNPEIKRKVIGQALEYGAHIWGMSYAELDEKVKTRTGKNLAPLIEEQADDPAWDEEAFRENVEDALESGSFILMIVVDAITDELSRIIRFVNACGNPAFSFAALEMRRFQSGDAEMLVPRIIGDTRTSDKLTSANRRKQTNREEMLSKCSPEISDFFSDLLDSADEQGDTVYWGTVGFSIRTYIPEMENLASIAYGYPPDIFQVYFGHLPFSDETILELRNEFMNMGIFREAPKTLTANLNSENIQQAKEAYDLMMNKVKELSSH